MIQQIKKLAGETMIYGFSTIITSLISVFLIPVYTKIFLPEDYGIINLINVTLTVLYIIVIFGLDNSTALWYWKKDTEEERRKTFSAWVIFQLSFAILLSSTLILFSSFFSEKITGSRNNYLLIIITASYFPLWSFQKVVNMWFRLRRKAWHAVFFALFITVSTVSFSITYVVFFKLGLKGAFYAQLTSSVLAFIIGVFLLRSIFSFRFFSFQRLGEMILYSYPLVPAAVCSWILTSASSYFIKNLKNTSEVGLYQIGVNIASLTNIIVSAFLQAWSPFALSIHKESNHKEIYGNVFTLYSVLGSIVVCGIFIFSHEVLKIFTTPKYFQAYWVAGIFSVNILIAGIYQITSIGCNLSGTNAPYSVAVIIGSLIAVILYYLLIPSFGKEGAAIATTLANAFIAWFLASKAQKLYPIPYDFKSFIFLVALMVTISTMANVITAEMYGWESYLLKIFFFLCYLLLIGLYYLKFKKVSFLLYKEKLLKQALRH